MPMQLCNCNLQLSLSMVQKKLHACDCLPLLLFSLFQVHALETANVKADPVNQFVSAGVVSGVATVSIGQFHILSKNSFPKANCRAEKKGGNFPLAPNFAPNPYFSFPIPIVDKEEYRATIGHQTINIPWCLQAQCWGSPPSCCPSWSPRCRSARTRRAGWPPSVTSASCSGPWPPVFWPGSLVEFLQ